MHGQMDNRDVVARRLRLLVSQSAAQGHRECSRCDDRVKPRPNLCVRERCVQRSLRVLVEKIVGARRLNDVDRNDCHQQKG